MRARVVRSGADGPARRKPNPEKGYVLRRRQAEAARDADALLGEARRQAAELMEQAQVEAARRARSVRSEAERERALALMSLQQEAEAALDEQLARLQNDIGRLAAAVAKKVIGQELQLAPERIVEIVAQVVQGVRPAARASIRVNPADAPQLERQTDRLRRALASDEVVLEVDASIERGGCIVETPLVQADGRLTIQLEALAQAAEEHLRGAKAAAGEPER
jgi:flagellar assembly protein FliH